MENNYQYNPYQGEASNNTSNSQTPNNSNSKKQKIKPEKPHKHKTRKTKWTPSLLAFMVLFLLLVVFGSILFSVEYAYHRRIVKLEKIKLGLALPEENKEKFKDFYTITDPKKLIESKDRDHVYTGKIELGKLTKENFENVLATTSAYDAFSVFNYYNQDNPVLMNKTKEFGLKIVKREAKLNSQKKYELRDTVFNAEHEEYFNLTVINSYRPSRQDEGYFLILTHPNKFTTYEYKFEKTPQFNNSICKVVTDVTPNRNKEEIAIFPKDYFSATTTNNTTDDFHREMEQIIEKCGVDKRALSYGRKKFWMISEKIGAGSDVIITKILRTENYFAPYSEAEPTKCKFNFLSELYLTSAQKDDIVIEIDLLDPVEENKTIPFTVLFFEKDPLNKKIKKDSFNLINTPSKSEANLNDYLTKVKNASYNPNTEKFNFWTSKEITGEFSIFTKTYNDGDEFKIFPSIGRTKFEVFFFESKEKLNQYFTDPSSIDKSKDIFDSYVLSHNEILYKTAKELRKDEGYKHTNNWSLCDSKEKLQQIDLPKYEYFDTEFNDLNRKKDFFFIPIIEYGVKIKLINYYASEISEPVEKIVRTTFDEEYGFKGDSFFIPTAEDARSSLISENERNVLWFIDPQLKANETYNEFSEFYNLTPDNSIVINNENAKLKEPVTLVFYPRFNKTRINVDYYLENSGDKDDNTPIIYDEAEERNINNFLRTHKYDDYREIPQEKEFSNISWLSDDKDIIRKKIKENASLEQMLLYSDYQDEKTVKSLLGYEIDREKTLVANTPDGQPTITRFTIDLSNQNNPQVFKIYLKRKRVNININYNIRVLNERNLNLETLEEKFFKEIYYFGNKQLKISAENLDKLSQVHSYNNDGWSIEKVLNDEYKPNGTPGDFQAGNYERKWSTDDGNNFISFEDKPIYLAKEDLNIDQISDINFYVCYKRKANFSIRFYLAKDYDKSHEGVDTEFDFSNPVNYSPYENNVSLTQIEMFRPGGEKYKKMVNGQNLRVAKFVDESKHSVTTKTLKEDGSPIYVFYHAPAKVKLLHRGIDGKTPNTCYFNDGSNIKEFYPEETFDFRPNVPEYNNGNVFKHWEIFNHLITSDIPNSTAETAVSKTFTYNDQTKEFTMVSHFKYFIFALRFFYDTNINPSTHEVNFTEFTTSTYKEEQNELSNIDLPAILDRIEKQTQYDWLTSFRFSKKYTRLFFNQAFNAGVSNLQSLDLYNFRGITINCYLLKNDYIFDFKSINPSNGSVETYPQQIKHYGHPTYINTFKMYKGYKIEDRVQYKKPDGNYEYVSNGPNNIGTVLFSNSHPNYGLCNDSFKKEIKAVTIKFNNELINTERLEFSTEIKASYQRKESIKVEVFNIIEKYTKYNATAISEYASKNEGNFVVPYITQTGSVTVNNLTNCLLYNVLFNSYSELFPSSPGQKMIGKKTTLYKFARKIAVVKEGSSEIIKTHQLQSDVAFNLTDFTNWDEHGNGDEKLIVYMFYYAPLEITNPEVLPNRNLVFPGETVDKTYFKDSKITVVNFTTSVLSENINQNYEINYLVQDEEQNEAKQLDLKPSYVLFSVTCHYLIRNLDRPDLFEIKQKIFNKYYRYKDNILTPTNYRFIDKVISEINLSVSLDSRIDSAHYIQTSDKNKYNEHRRKLNLTDVDEIGSDELYAYPKEQYVKFIGSKNYHWYYKNHSYVKNAGFVETYFYTCIPKTILLQEKVHRRLNGQDEGFQYWKKPLESSAVSSNDFYPYHDGELVLEASFDASKPAPSEISFSIVDRDHEITFDELWKTHIINDKVTLDCHFSKAGASIQKYYVKNNSGVYEEKSPGSKIDYELINGSTIEVEFTKPTLLLFSFANNSAITNINDLDEDSKALITNIKILPGNVYHVRKLFAKIDSQRYLFKSMKYGANTYGVDQNITISTDRNIEINFVKCVNVASYTIDGKNSTDNLTNPNALDNLYYFEKNVNVYLPEIRLKEGNQVVTSYSIYRANDQSEIIEVNHSQIFQFDDSIDEVVIFANFVSGEIDVNYKIADKEFGDFSLLNSNQANILRSKSKVHENDSFPLPTPNVEGYRFIRWEYEWKIKYIKWPNKTIIKLQESGHITSGFKFQKIDKTGGYTVKSNIYNCTAIFEKSYPVVYRGLGESDNSFSYIRDSELITKLQGLRFLKPGQVINLPVLNADTDLDQNTNEWRIEIYKNNSVQRAYLFDCGVDYTIPNDQADKYIISPITKPLVKIDFDFSRVGGELNIFDILHNASLENHLKGNMRVKRGSLINLDAFGSPNVPRYQKNRYTWLVKVNDDPTEITVIDSHTVTHSTNNLVFILIGTKQVELHYNFASIGLAELDDFSYLTPQQIAKFKQFANKDDAIKLGDDLKPQNVPNYQIGRWYYLRNSVMTLVPASGYKVTGTDTNVVFYYIAKKKVIVNYDFSSIGLNNLNDFSKLSSNETLELKSKRYFNDGETLDVTFNPSFAEYENCSWQIVGGTSGTTLPYVIHGDDNIIVCKLITKKKIIVTYDFSDIKRSANDFSWLEPYQATELEGKLLISRNNPFAISFNPAINGYQTTSWSYSENDSVVFNNLVNYTPNGNVNTLTIKLVAKPKVKFYYDFSQVGLSSYNDFSLLKDHDRNTLINQLTKNTNETFAVNFDPEIRGYRFIKWTYHTSLDSTATDMTLTGTYLIVEGVTSITITLHVDKGIPVKYYKFGTSINQFDYCIGLTPADKELFVEYFYEYSDSTHTEKTKYRLPERLRLKGKHFKQKYSVKAEYNGGSSYEAWFASNSYYEVNFGNWNNIRYIAVTPLYGDYINLTYEFQDPNVTMDLVSAAQKAELDKFLKYNPYVDNSFPILNIAGYPFSGYQYEANSTTRTMSFDSATNKYILAAFTDNFPPSIKVIINTKRKLETKLVIARQENEAARGLITNLQQLSMVNVACNQTFDNHHVTLPMKLDLAGYNFYKWKVEFYDNNGLISSLVQNNLATDFIVNINNNNITRVVYHAIIQLNVLYNINGVTDFSNVLDPSQVTTLSNAIRLQRDTSAHIKLPLKISIYGHSFVKYCLNNDLSTTSLFTNNGSEYLLNYNYSFDNVNEITITPIFEVFVTKLVRDNSDNDLYEKLYNENLGLLNSIVSTTTLNRRKYDSGIFPHIVINGYVLINFKVSYVLNDQTSDTQTYVPGSKFSVTVSGSRFYKEITVTAQFRKRAKVNVVVVENSISHNLDSQSYITNLSMYEKYIDSYVSSSNNILNLAGEPVVSEEMKFNKYLLHTLGTPDKPINLNTNYTLSFYDKEYTIKIMLDHRSRVNVKVKRGAETLELNSQPYVTNYSQFTNYINAYVKDGYNTSLNFNVPPLNTNSQFIKFTLLTDGESDIDFPANNNAVLLQEVGKNYTILIVLRAI